MQGPVHSHSWIRTDPRHYREGWICESSFYLRELYALYTCVCLTDAGKYLFKFMLSHFQAKILSDVGGVVLANACGPCIGQWDRYEPIGRANNVTLACVG